MPYSFIVRFLPAEPLGVASAISTQLPLLKAGQQQDAWRAHLQGTTFGFSVHVEPGSLIESVDGDVLLLP